METFAIYFIATGMVAGGMLAYLVLICLCVFAVLFGLAAIVATVKWLAGQVDQLFQTHGQVQLATVWAGTALWLPIIALVGAYEGMCEGFMEAIDKPTWSNLLLIPVSPFIGVFRAVGVCFAAPYAKFAEGGYRSESTVTPVPVAA